MDVLRRRAKCLARQLKVRFFRVFARRWVALGAFTVVVGLLVIAGGCATTQDDDSDLPWNVRQPWEGAPSIPGMRH